MMSFKHRDKSIARPATLFKASAASAFVYRLSNITDVDMAAINALMTSYTPANKDINARLEYIKSHSIDMTLVGNKIMPGQIYSIFETNLDTLRGDMQEMLNNFLLINYLHDSHPNKVSEICDILIELNPMHKPNPRVFYPRAIKDFLYASLTGLAADKEWDGMEAVNKYSISDSNRRALVINACDKESYRSYLFTNTNIERPLVLDKKYAYAEVYTVNGDYFFDLNFQLQFID